MHTSVAELFYQLLPTTAKTAGRNVAFMVAKMGVGQSDIWHSKTTREVAIAGSSTDEEVLEDLERNADLYNHM